MASIRKTATKKTEKKKAQPRYVVDYRDPRGKSKEKWFKTKAEAERFRAKVKADIDQGRYIDPNGGRTRLGEWIEKHEATKTHRRPSTEARDRSVLDTHVLPVFAEMQIARIETIRVRAWVADMNAAGYAPDTVRKAHRLLNSALEAAVEDRLIARNPAARVDLPQQRKQEMRFLTVEEVDALVEAIDPRYRAMTLTVAHTGLRFGEAAGLRLDRLNLLKRTLRVDQTVTRSGVSCSTGSPRRRRPGGRFA